MGKNKLLRWNELATFENVIQPLDGEVGADHPVKGEWNKKIFRNSNPVVLELGCGKGEYTIGLATKFHDKNFIGVDIKGARMWRGAKTSNEMKLANAAFLRTRIEFITSFFSTDEADEIWITFPDPHPGGTNSNKRLTSPWYLNKYRLLLKDGGIIHLKTDSSELYNYTRSVVIHNKLTILSDTSDLYSGVSIEENLLETRFLQGQKPPADILSIKTHYEKLFLQKGLKINYISFILRKDKNIEYAY